MSKDKLLAVGERYEAMIATDKARMRRIAENDARGLFSGALRAAMFLSTGLRRMDGVRVRGTPWELRAAHENMLVEVLFYVFATNSGPQPRLA